MSEILSVKYKYFKTIDLFVLIIFTLTAFLGLFLFRHDLMRTLDARGLEPVGTIIIRENVVQRRHDDRTIWDRLFVESPVYSGDLIRVAELSAASIFIEDNQINVNENTLIRIQRLFGARGNFEVELHEGNLSLESGDTGGTLQLNINGNIVQTEAGSVINAAVDEDGISVQISEGIASFVSAGGEIIRRLTEGSIFSRDSSGEERIVPSAVVISPKRNARFLNPNINQSLPVAFTIQKINMNEDTVLRLDISQDRSFSNNVVSFNFSERNINASFDNGSWFWRIVNITDTDNDSILSSGRLEVIDSSGPELSSPVTGTLIRYTERLPQIRFQWRSKPNASGYNIEVSRYVNFTEHEVNREVSSTSFVFSNLEAGTWYWRVRPLFSSAFEGVSGFSRTGFFTIDKINVTENNGNLPLAEIEMEIPEIETVAAIIAELPAAIEIPVPVSPLDSLPVLQRSSEIPVIEVPAAQPRREPEPVVTPSAPGTYTVVAGDTLARIAGKVYGNNLLWRRILEANTDIIKNQDLIFPGQVFVIP